MSTSRDTALAALRAFSEPGHRARLLAAAWTAGATNVNELAEAARCARQTVYTDLRSRGIDPDHRPKETTDMLAPLTIDGITGLDPDADGLTILNATHRYAVEHPDGKGIGEFESELVRLQRVLELYNLRASAAADEITARRTRDRALHLVETRWEALDSAPNDRWIAAHHSYVKAVHEARHAIAAWCGEADRLWGVEGVGSLSPLHQELYQRRVLGAGHPDVETVKANPAAEAERLLTSLDTAHKRRQAIAADTLGLATGGAATDSKETL